jgi:hypothetical protein
MRTVINTMKTEKKLIAYSAIALLIGVASIAPMLFLMSGTANAQTEPDKPWFNLNIPYAYWNPNVNGDNGTTTFFGEVHNIVANITADSNAVLKDADARIEYYQLQVYSDQGPICNLTYYVGIAKSGELFDMYNSTMFFLSGNTYSTNSTNGGIFILDIDLTNMTSWGLISGSTLSYNSTRIPQVATDTQNANVLYIDVSRLSYVTFNGNTTTVTTESSDVLQHIELTKTNNGFVYGTTTNLNVPFPLEGPTTTHSPPVIFIPSNSTTTPSNATVPNPSISQGSGSTNQP